MIEAIGSPAGATPATRLERLQTIQTCLFQDCHLIHIYSDDRQEAYRLFRILNDRGRAIGDGDKLKSNTLEQLEGNPTLQDLAETQWDAVLAMGPAEVDSFLQIFYTAHTGEKSTKRDLFDDFTDKLLTPPALAAHQQFVADRVGQIHAARDLYAAIADGVWPYQNSALPAWQRDRLSRLIQVLRHTLCVPLLLAVRDTQTEQTFSEVVRLLERFAFRYVSIVGGHHSPPTSAYENAIKTIRATPTAFRVAPLQLALRVLINTYASDAVFETALFAKLDYRQSHVRKLIKHFLTTIEDHRAWLTAGARGVIFADETRVFDVGVNTIEHIYPQNAQAAHVDAALEPVKHLIPNLSFWGGTDNQAAGNLPFAQKQPLYLQSAVHMNRDLGQLAAWSATELAARRQTLWNAARQVFAI